MKKKTSDLKVVYTYFSEGSIICLEFPVVLSNIIIQELTLAVGFTN